MALKLYGALGSPNTGRALVTLFEKAVTDFEFVKISIQAGEQKKPEFLSMQPFGAVPVLVDGPITLFESRAIARFIAHKFDGQGSSLYGSSPKDKALVEQWLEVEGQNYHPPILAIIREKFFKVGGKTDKAVVDANVEKLNKVLDVYEAHLAKSKYLAGDFFSLADLSHIPFTHLLFALANMGDLIEAKPHVKAWWEDISSRPAWKKVLDMFAKK